MSIWVIIETTDEVTFIEHEDFPYQTWDIINNMSNNYRDSPIQIPKIICHGGYENGLNWSK